MSSGDLETIANGPRNPSGVYTKIAEATSTVTTQPIYGLTVKPFLSSQDVRTNERQYYQDAVIQQIEDVGGNIGQNYGGNLGTSQPTITRLDSNGANNATTTVASNGQTYAKVNFRNQ